MGETHALRNKLGLAGVVVLLGLSGAHAQSIQVLNAASFLGDAAISPGSIISVFGSNLSVETDFTQDLTFPPLTLAGTRVTVNGTPSGLLYVSPTQINAVIDRSVPPGPAVLTVKSPAGTFQASFTLQSHAIPAVFASTGAGSGDGAILDAATFESGPFRVSSGGEATILAIYTTALAATPAPDATIGGIPVAVAEYLEASPFGGAVGQLNVVLPGSLAGAGRLEVAVESGDKRSNVVEVVILAPPAQGEEETTANAAQSPELSSLAWVPGTTTVLVTDATDDVIGVVDTSQRRVVAVIPLPEGAQPMAVAVDAGLNLAVVAERGRHAAALIDLRSMAVQGEVPVGLGPVSVAISGDVALVVNQYSNSVAFVDLRTLETTSVPVGLVPRAVAVAQSEAFVTNQTSGTISRIRLSDRTVSGTLTLGENVRPAAVRFLEQTGMLLVSEPSAGPDGKLLVVNPVDGAVTTLKVNPDQSGGLTDAVVSGNDVFFTNQAGGAINAVPLGAFTGQPVLPAVQSVKVESGPRAMTVDTSDNLLLVLNEGAGTISMIDLSTKAVVGSIQGISTALGSQGSGGGPPSGDSAPPSIKSIEPDTAVVGTSFTLTVTGSHLGGTTGVEFLNPMKGGVADEAFSLSNISVNSTGTLLTATVQISSPHAPAVRVVRLTGPRGDSGSQIAIGNALTVQP